ncbi:hypothetical protein LshimejAT787_0704360 [Lyophyllum shimeji]|uniref:SAP domain-containing protein n=1 Tax=Lyophyllum shimeji TaxID=47721 RepID=A0A9P3UR66_LYOSH|nr:hypothetical protein LshimejAT787_0704360 [Lyophyllum shimeji]
MSTTTQILFNSPALHSLKRDQLVKLCKIHSIKASGKNTELIERLKKHAGTLFSDSPLSVAARNEEVAGVNVPVGVAGEDETMDEGQATAEEQSQSSNARWGFQMPRPSEQWEVVMESIEEDEERSSQGTLSSMRTVGSNNGGSGEFGTGMSKSSSVSSSIKALASSLGLRRGNTSKSTLASSSFPPSSSSKSMLHLSSLPPKDDELEQHSTPYSSLPEPDTLPQSDHLTFDHPMEGVDWLRPTQPPSPLPGHSLRPGVPAPADARLSLGLNAPSTPTRKDQPTTTIRLISNPVSDDEDTNSYGRTPQLKPFRTSFDLVLGSPEPNTGGFRGVSLWPSSSENERGIYPPLPLELPVSSSSAAPAPTDMVTDTYKPMPGSLSQASKPATNTIQTPAPTTAATTHLVAPEPFIFGSPLPQHHVSNAQFASAAASVLEEMNRRLQAEGVAGVDAALVSKLQPGAHAHIPGVGTDLLGAKEAKEAAKAKLHKEKFDEIHAEEFSKMEGIDALARRRGMKDPGAGAGEEKESAPAIGKKRKSSVLGHGAGRDRYGRRTGEAAGRISATRVISNGRRPRAIPGSFDDDDSEDEETRDEDERDGKRARVDPSPMPEDTKQEDETRAKEEEEKAKAEEEERKKKEKEAIRRKLELSKARRRSSAGVPGARGRVSVGRGGVLLKPQPPPKPSRFGFLSSAKSLVQKVWGGGKSTAASAATSSTSGIPKPTSKLSKAAPAPAGAPAPSTKKVAAVGNARPSSAAHPPSSRVSSLRVEKNNPTGTVTSITSARSRSPIPSFGTAPSTRSSLAKPSRSSSIVGTGTSSKTGSAVSSIGTRSSLTSSNKVSSLGGVGSMGAKKLSTGVAGRSSTASAAGSGSSSSRLSSRLSSSRLLAPTASSLAKARPSASGSGSSLKTVAETSAGQKSQSGEALGTITNDAGAVAKSPQPLSPRPGGIFSRPLTMPSGIPTPVKKRPGAPPTLSSADGAENQDGGHAEDVKDVSLASTSTTTAGVGVPPARQRSITGRKPRISRSKVIAKLASQRAAGTGRLAGNPGERPQPARDARVRVWE